MMKGICATASVHAPIDMRMFMSMYWATVLPKTLVLSAAFER